MKHMFLLLVAVPQQCKSFPAEKMLHAYLNAEVATEHRLAPHPFNSSYPNQVKALPAAHPCGAALSTERIGFLAQHSGARQKWNWKADRISFFFGSGIRAGRQSSRRPSTTSQSCFRGTLDFNRSSFRRCWNTCMRGRSSAGTLQDHTLKPYTSLSCADRSEPLFKKWQPLWTAEDRLREGFQRT